MSALCTALVITDPVRSYFYLSISNDEHSFTAVFIHQTPFSNDRQSLLPPFYCFPPPNTLSNDEHSFTAIFIHQPPFPTTDSCFYCHFTVFHHQTCFPTTDSRFHCRFTVFHHQTRFPTTNTRLQPFSFTCNSFHRQILFYSCFSHFQRRTLVYSHFHPPTSLSNNKHSFTAIFHYHTCFPTTKILLQLFSSTNLPFHRQILFYSCFPPPYMHFHHLSIKQRTVIFTLLLLKRRTDAEAECTEDGRNGQIGATEYAEGNGTRKRGGDAERIT